MRRNGRRQRARLGITRMIAKIERFEQRGRTAKQSLQYRLWNSLTELFRKLADAKPRNDLRQ